MSPARRQQPEKAEQANGVHLLRSLGAQVYVLGTRRRSGDYQGTMQTPGVPDVLFFLPPHVDDSARLVAWECKAPGGRASAPQIQFQAHCRCSGVDHVLGGLDALIEHLIRRKRLKPSQLAWYKAAGRSIWSGCMKHYLSGPMSGLPELNYPAFARAASELRARGLTVVSAHEVAHPETAPGQLEWHVYLRAEGTQ